ncbi:MAG: hypothetical protein H7Y11_06955, partial [Armatimonadetes bacterium]|nr:hypothetical protein [Anaerolineae bacterium]
MRHPLLLGLLLLLLTSFVTAQDQTLVYGQPVTNTVSTDQTRFRYSFEGAASEVIYLAAFIAQDGLVLELQLFGPNGTLLGSAVDNALGSMLGPVTLGSAGRYTVEVAQPDYNQGTIGTFDLLLDRAALTPVKPDGRYTG